jgi:hypothetical protein
MTNYLYQTIKIKTMVQPTQQYISKIIAIIFIAWLFSACSQTPYETSMEKKIVVYGHLSNTRPASIWLTSSVNLGSGTKTIPTIENAVVNLYQGNNFIEQLTHDKTGHYVGTSIPMSDSEYSIEISAKGFPDAKCQLKVPKNLNAKQEKLVVEQSYFDTTYVYMDIVNGDTMYREVVVKDTIISLIVDIAFIEQENEAIYRAHWLHTKPMEYTPDDDFTYSTSGYLNSSPELDFNYMFYFKEKYRFNNGISKGTKVNTTLQNDFVSTEVEFPIIISYHFEQLTQDSWDFYQQYEEYRYQMYKIRTDTSMWVNPNENEFMINYIPYVFMTNVEGGMGYITCGSGIGESVIIEKGFFQEN